MNENKFWAVFWTLCTILILAFIAACLYTCERTDERRAKCIDSGHSSTECKDLFRGPGDNR